MPSKSYINPETTVVWTDTGGDKLLDLGGLSASSGIACGAYLDLGASARADLYEIVMIIDGFGGAPTVGQTVDLFITQSNNGTEFDGQASTAPTSSAQGTVTTEQTRNMLYAGSAVVHLANASAVLQARFIVRLTGRYVAPVVVNRTGQALLASGDDHEVRMTPVPQEMQ